MSNELFINFMREKGLEPNQIDLKNFDFMARSLMQDEIERLEDTIAELGDNYTALSKANQWFIKRIAELESLLKRVSQDLLMRAELDTDGFKVVDLSSSIWINLKKALMEQK
jgi:hypothetical protein